MQPYKIRYEVDPHNRLVALRSKRKTGVLKYREVLDGRFSINKNRLTYHIKKSSGYNKPQQIKFSGNWSLDKEHNLALTLDKWNNQAEGDSLTIKGSIIDVKSNELVFSVISGNYSGKKEFYTLSITGFWQADEYNRLAFLAERRKGSPDILTLEGSWEVSRQNQITYTYTKKNLKRKEKRSRQLSFKGYWDVTEKYRVSYVLNTLDSRFDFKTGAGSYVKNALRYEIAVGALPEKRRITLSGAWKINNKLGVLFEMENEDNKPQSIIFGATCKLGENGAMDLKLKNRLNEDLGVELKLSKALLKGKGESFIRALSSGEEKAIFAGAGFKW